MAISNFNRFLLVAFLISCGQPYSQKQLSDTSLKLNEACDNPDAPIDCCFQGAPANVNHVMWITGPDEPGEKLVISGTIFKADGLTPYEGVMLYAYHTDNSGLYSKTGKEKGVQKWHGRLHGWCKTGKDGHYRIHTIRPARYPSNTMPAHIHSAIKTPEGKMMYINDFVFHDDSLVNDRYISMQLEEGGDGVLNATMNSEGIWTAFRDIVLK
jgi:protocatechuate 3,4-dioxygenase beta subunit